MGWRREVRDLIAELEAERLRLEAARDLARESGTPEGPEREERLRAEILEVSRRINDLRASLE